MATTHATRSTEQKRSLPPLPTPNNVRYSPRWMGASATLATLAALAAQRGGLAMAAAVGAAGVAGAAYSVLVEPQRPVFEAFELAFPGLPHALDGLRIGQLSDMHLGHAFAAANTRWGVAQVMEAKPDLIALTGDFVSYRRAIADLPALLGPLQAPLGIYAVPGNHDYWEGVEDIQAALAPLGVEFLLNRQRRLAVGSDELVLAGVDDSWEGRSELAAALAGTPPNSFIVLLAHAPDIADEAAARGVALQLSGHTHGGHMSMPGLGAFCLPRHGWRYTSGHQRAGATHVYTNRGLGGMPLRLGCPPEATLITLRRA